MILPNLAYVFDREVSIILAEDVKFELLKKIVDRDFPTKENFSRNKELIS